MTPRKLDGKEVHANLIAVVGVAPTIPRITLVVVAVNMTSIVPLGAADARVQGVRVASRLSAAVLQPNKKLGFIYRNKTDNQRRICQIRGELFLPVVVGIKSAPSAGVAGVGHVGHTTGLGQVGHVGHLKIRKSVLAFASVS